MDFLLFYKPGIESGGLLNIFPTGNEGGYSNSNVSSGASSHSASHLSG